MTSSRVPDPPNQATDHDVPTHADASIIQNKSHQLNLLLDELERWATIVPRLSLDQRQEISEHLQKQISRLATLKEPSGTRDQQFIDLERLAGLQQGPLGKLLDHGESLVIMDDVICNRLRALSGKVMDEQLDISLGTELRDKDPVINATLCTTSSTSRISRRPPSSMTPFEDARMNFEDGCLMLFQNDQSLEAEINEKDVKGVVYWKRLGMVELSLMDGRYWDLSIEDDKTASALLSWFCGC